MLLLLDNEPGMVVAGITDRLPGLVTQLETAQAEQLLLGWNIPKKRFLTFWLTSAISDAQPKFSSYPAGQKKRMGSWRQVQITLTSKILHQKNLWTSFS